jgi:putative NADPH-quinone reductase
MKNALVLLGHADPGSFNAALAGAYDRAFREAGGRSTLVTLSSLSFDPVLRHGFAGEQPLEPDLLRLRALFEAADHVAWVFPTYWASPPAIVRAVVDRLFLPGWAFRYEAGRALPTQLLAGRSGRVVTTMDSPSWWYSVWHHRAIHGAFVNGTLRFVGFDPVKATPIYRTRALGEAQRAAWVARMATLAREDLSRRVPRDLRRLPDRSAPIAPTLER